MDYSNMKIKDIKAAADRGSSGACIEMYRRNMENFENTSMAEEYLNKAKRHLYEVEDDNEKEEICLSLADIYMEKDPKEARRNLELARELGSIRACIKLVNFYKKGIGGPVDLESAKICQDIAFDHISPTEKLAIAKERYKEGSILEACSYYEDVRDNDGSSIKEKNLAKLYLIAINHKRYLKNFEQLSSMVEGISSDEIDNIYSILAKSETEKNFKIILEISKIEKAFDTSFANYYLGTHYLEGKCVSQNFGLGMGKLAKSGNDGNIDAQLRLSEIYYSGNQQENLDSDPKRGFEWLSKAADSGSVPAQFKIGMSYWKGEGVAKDIDKAAYWLGKAAEKRNVDAMREMGMLCLSGKDLDKAMYWLLEACSLGDAKSAAQIGYNYRHGIAAEVNYEKALKYYKIAKKIANEKAIDIFGLDENILFCQEEIEKSKKMKAEAEKQAKNAEANTSASKTTSSSYSTATVKKADERKSEDSAIKAYYSKNNINNNSKNNLKNVGNSTNQAKNVPLNKNRNKGANKNVVPKLNSISGILSMIFTLIAAFEVGNNIKMWNVISDLIKYPGYRDQWFSRVFEGRYAPYEAPIIITILLIILAAYNFVRFKSNKKFILLIGNIAVFGGIMICIALGAEESEFSISGYAAMAIIYVLIMSFITKPSQRSKH